MDSYYQLRKILLEKLSLKQSRVSLMRNGMILAILLLTVAAMTTNAWMAGSHPSSGSFSSLDIQLSDPVQTDKGMVRGEVLGDIVAFRGVPYVAPPVGDLRWKPPQPAQPWDGVLDAVTFGNGCAQPADPTSIPVNVIGSEDCLTLNIWAPKNQEATLRPVMVFTHGGGNNYGDSSIPVYDGLQIAEKGGVILVSFNYRLGVLGFLAHPGLSHEDSDHNSSGNYGLLDQIAALQWVQRNIRNFGGDPNNVTIFGESSGGVDVGILITSPLAKGLFHKAIIESGLVSPVGHSSRIFVDRPIRDDSGNATVGTAEGDGVKLSTALGCESADDPLQCLRSKTAQELYGPRRVLVCTGMGISNGPNVDGYVIPAPVLETLKKGEQNNVPLMIGTNKDEGAGTVTEFAPFVVSMIKTDADYRLLVKTVFADKADQILARYPAADYASPNAAFEQLVSDLFFLAPARLYSRQIALKQSQLFTYQFTHVLKGTPLARLGAYHSAELNYVFYNFDVYPFTDGIKPKQKEFKLGDSMVAYWTNFAKHGDPNDGKLPQWPAYTLDGDTTILLDTKIRTAQGLRKDYADFLAQLFVTDTSFTTPCDKGN